MSENKTIRLMTAAKEFNIGAATLVEFLNKKGFEVKNSPMEKLSQEMYESVQAEYATDKKVKEKSEGINIPKSSAIKSSLKADEPKAAKEAEAPKVEVSKQKLDGPKIVDKIDLEAVGKTSKKTAKVEEETPEEEAPVKKTTKKTAKKEETPAVAQEEAPAKKTKKSKEDAEKVAIEAPKISGPKVVNKIDLDSIGKIEEEPAEEVEEVEQESAAEEAQAPVIENVVERKKLDGLKIMGKIELPTPSDKSQSAASREKRKRKRIPVDKQGVPDNKTGDNRNNNNNNRNNNNNNRTFGKNGRRNDKGEDKIIDESQIQDKIKETLAKLGGQTRGKSQKSKYRKTKREEMAEKRAAGAADSDETELQVTEFISVNELASLMNVSFADVISKCMSLGMMVSINQRLDAEVIELVASEFGYSVKFINLEQEAENEEEEIEDDPEELVARPPIVTIMGHVDHGKTSLLDHIRKTNVIAGEAGGITQHIGAYEVTLANGKAITFLDTPGHEAFTAMRARGAKITDIAVIVVAADDAVMPQTREAISHAQAAGVPMIFAINKIDKDGANPERIYEQLSSMNLLVESWGGKYQNQELAAKSGLNVDLLLEKILLEAELLDLKANPNRFASGSIIEASLDKGRGFVATILVQTGTLEVGDMLVAGSIYGRVKAMYNERGGKMESAGPSTPVQILGLNGAPQAGEKFKVYEDEDEAKEIANHRSQIMREQGMRTKKHITLDEIGRRLALGNFKQLNVIIKGDFDGSVEALSDSLQKLSTEEIVVSVVHKAVGQITESDVLLATASDAIILGFQVRPSSQANKLAEAENIEIRTYSVIYDAIEEIKLAMEGMLEPKVERKTVCNIEVREVFKITGVGAIAGCFVLEGKINRNTKVNLIRDGIVVYNGELSSLKRFKDDAKEVLAGQECGIGIKNYNDLRQGDIIEGYDEIEVKRTL